MVESETITTGDGFITHTHETGEIFAFAYLINITLEGDRHLKQELPINPKDDSLFGAVNNGIILWYDVCSLSNGFKQVAESHSRGFDLRKGHKLQEKAAQRISEAGKSPTSNRLCEIPGYCHNRAPSRDYHGWGYHTYPGDLVAAAEAVAVLVDHPGESPGSD